MLVSGEGGGWESRTLTLTLTDSTQAMGNDQLDSFTYTSDTHYQLWVWAWQKGWCLGVWELGVWVFFLSLAVSVLGCLGGFFVLCLGGWVFRLVSV